MKIIINELLKKKKNEKKSKFLLKVSKKNFEKEKKKLET